MAATPFGSQQNGLAWSGDLNIETVRRIDAMVQKGEQNRGRMEAEIAALANEDRLYQAIINGPDGQHGWKTYRKPMHRVADINLPTAELFRGQADAYPLTCRVIKYGDDGQIEWFQTRPVWVLSEDELYSDPKYMAVYDLCAAKGLCSPRVPRKAEPGTEPSPDDRLELAKAVQDAMNGITYDYTTYPLRSQLGCLITGLKNFSLPTLEAIDLAWTGNRMEDGIETGRRLEQLAEQVPALAEVVERIKQRKQAA